MEETTVPARVGIADEDIDWMELYAHKAKEYDRMTNAVTARELVLRELYNLYAKWTEEARNPNTFAPDPEVDKTARTRTGACAEELRKVLHGN